MANLDVCTIGLRLMKPCHLKTWTRKTGIESIGGFNPEEMRLLEWRTNLKLELDGTVCLHHKNDYLDKFSDKFSKCCDPFKKHKRSKLPISNLHTIKLEEAEQFNMLSMDLVPGIKVCLR